MKQKEDEADKLVQKGFQQFQKRQFQESLQSCQQALKIYQEIQNRWGEGQALKNLGNAYLFLKDLTRAIECFQQALKIALELNDCELKGRALHNLGRAYEEFGNFAKAIEYYQQSLAIAQEIPNRELEWKALYNLGKTYSTLKDYVKAIYYFEQYLTIAQELKDLPTLSQVLMNLGYAYFLLGDTLKAIDVRQQRLTVARELKDPLTEGWALLDLALTYKDLKDYTKAIEYSKQSLTIEQEEYSKQSLTTAQEAQEIQEINNRMLEESALGCLGGAYAAIGESAEAIKLYQQSLAIARELRNSKFKGIALNALRSEDVTLSALYITYNLFGDNAKAIEYLQQKLALMPERKDRQEDGEILIQLGAIYQEQGNYIEAIKCFEQSLALAKEIGNTMLEVQSLDWLGNIYSVLGNFNKARQYCEHNLEIIRAFNNSQTQNQNISREERLYINYLRDKEVLALLSLGSTYIHGFEDLSQAIDYLNKAIDYFQQSLALAQELKVTFGEDLALSNLGNAYSGLGDFRKAINYYEQSLELTRKDQRPQYEFSTRQQEGLGLQFLVRPYAWLGEHTKAIEYAQQSLAILQKGNSLLMKATALGELGYAFFLAGNLLEAEKAMLEAIEGFECVRAGLGNNDAYKVSFSDTQSQTYRVLQQVLVAQNKTDAALEIAERKRGRAFVELLTKRLSAKLDTQLTINSPNIEQIKQIARKKNATLVEYSFTYDEHLTVDVFTSVLLPMKFQGIAGSPESELFIWVVKPTGEVTFRKANLRPLRQQQNTSLVDLVIQARKFLGVEEKQSDITLSFSREAPLPIRHIYSPLQQLHQILIEPIAALLPTDPNASVIFIPEGNLFLVPFSALQDCTGKYLIEQHTILTAPSIQTLDLTHRHPSVQNQEVLVVGNPTMPTIPLIEPPKPLDPLPEAEAEAIAIASFLNTTAIIGNQATKVDIVQRMPQARLIHMATHGLLNDIRQMGIPGAIALAPSDNDNGFLTSGEIIENLKLNAELVVLSGCRTGEGQITGDGVIGLSRSLLIAGVSSVIVSLWLVMDRPSQEMMIEFYQNLLQGQMNKAQALRQSMLTMLKRYPKRNPRIWAGFILIGEAD